MQASYQVHFYEIVIVLPFIKVPQFIGFAICLSVALLLFFSLFSFQGAKIEDTLACTLKIKHCKPAGILAIIYRPGKY